VNLLPAINDWKDPKEFKKFKNTTTNTYDNDENHYKKKNKTTSTSTTTNDDDDDTSYEVQQCEEMKLLLKFPNDTKSCPSGCEGYQKGYWW
jgi:hypothetical protein